MQVSTSVVFVYLFVQGKVTERITIFSILKNAFYSHTPGNVSWENKSKKNPLSAIRTDTFVSHGNTNTTIQNCHKDLGILRKVSWANNYICQFQSKIKVGIPQFTTNVYQCRSTVMFLTTECWSSNRTPPTSIRLRGCPNWIKGKSAADRLPKAWLSLETSNTSTVWNWD